MHDLPSAIILASELRDENLITLLDEALRRTMHEHDRLLGYRRYASGAIAYLEQNGSLWS